MIMNTEFMKVDTTVEVLNGAKQGMTGVVLKNPMKPSSNPINKKIRLVKLSDGTFQYFFNCCLGKSV